MIAQNPFAELSAMISPEIMQGYIILMVLAVIAGTVLDMMHKQSAKYFFENAKKAQQSAKRTLSGGEKAGFAIQTLTQTSPFGFVTSDEAQTVLQVIANLQTRVQELEDRLEELGLIAAN